MMHRKMKVKNQFIRGKQTRPLPTKNRGWLKAATGIKRTRKIKLLYYRIFEW
jgi:hypothetical protein